MKYIVFNLIKIKCDFVYMYVVVQFYPSFKFYFSLFRLSKRVSGCGTTQFGQTRTITHNSEKFAKFRKILEYLLDILIKLIVIYIEYQDFYNMFRLFSGYLHVPSDTLEFPHSHQTTCRLGYTNNKVFLL